MEIVIINDNKEIFKREGKVVVFNTVKEAIDCVDKGRNYEALDYSFIKEIELRGYVETVKYDVNKKYFGK